MKTLAPTSGLHLAFVHRALTILVLMASATVAVPQGKGERLGKDYWWNKVQAYQGESKQLLLDANFRHDSRGGGPFSRLNRVAKDYVYNIHQKKDDEKFLRRLISDGLFPVETYESADGTAAAVFRDMETGRHIIAFRGTQVTEDWVNNAAEGHAGQGVGTTGIALHSGLFKDWAERYGKNGDLEVTGHSRGGGEAQIFTSIFGRQVARTVTFQSLGTDEATRRRWNNIPEEERGELFLAVAPGDVVADMGGDHMGHPKVLLFSGKDTAKKDSYYGHSSYLGQPPSLLDSDGNPYSSADDNRLIAVVDYFDYKTQVRGGALSDYLKSKGIDVAGRNPSTLNPDEMTAFLQKNALPPDHRDWEKKFPETPPALAVRRGAQPSTKPKPVATEPVPAKPAEPVMAHLVAQVGDGSKDPVEGLEGVKVKAVVNGQEFEGYTNSEGVAEFDISTGAQVSIKLFKSGYEQVNLSRQIVDGKVSISGVLDPIGQATLTVKIGDGATSAKTGLNGVKIRAMVKGGKDAVATTPTAGQPEGVAVLRIPAGSAVTVRIYKEGYEQVEVTKKIVDGTATVSGILDPIKIVETPAPSVSTGPYDGTYNGQLFFGSRKTYSQIAISVRGSVFSGAFLETQGERYYGWKTSGSFSGDVVPYKDSMMRYPAEDRMRLNGKISATATNEKGERYSVQGDFIGTVFQDGRLVGRVQLKSPPFKAGSTMSGYYDFEARR